MTEQWKEIPGFEGMYSISNMGRIKSHKRNTAILSIKEDFILKPKKTQNGYLQGCLSKACKKSYIGIHRLVAEAFIPNPLNKFTVNHIDGNKHNNNVNNLEWLSQKENNRHAIKIGLYVPHGESNSNNKYKSDQILQIIDLLMAGELDNSKISIQTGVPKYMIGFIDRYRNWTTVTIPVVLEKRGYLGDRIRPKVGLTLF